MSSHLTVRALLLSTVLAAATPALATNERVESALRSHPELSSFYRGMVNTGVMAELDPDTTYTIFAPNNAAMQRISQEKYPCFYAQQCSEQVADIMRNHIVEGPVLLGSGPRLSAAYSIDHTQITFGNISPNRKNTRSNNFTANGAPIVRNTAMGAGQLYTIDGVIASPQELAEVTQYRYVEVDSPQTVLIPMPTHSVVTTNQVFYAPDGTPDGISQTFTREPNSTY